MRTIGRLSLTTIVAAGFVVAVPAAAQAAVDCTFANGTNTATVALGNEDFDDRVWIGRQPSSKRLGYFTNAVGEWRGCDGATVTNTDKFKVIGGDLSDEVIVNLENGAIGPGATRNRAGVLGDRVGAQPWIRYGSGDTARWSRQQQARVYQAFVWIPQR